MANRKVDVPTYQAFGLFVERCLRNDHSMLWPQQTVWTLDSLNELKARTIDAPLLEANRPFEDKLREQLSGADPRLWQIIADTYYVYFLPSSYISFKKKVNDIRWAARQAGAEVPPEESEIWTALNLGYTTTSLKYHSKYSQFWLINLFAIHVKQSKDPELILADPGQLQTALDAILEGISSKPDRASDMRHALLYMAFPEDYERSISTRDKVRIVEHYGEDVPDLAADVDQGLKQVREHLGAVRPELGGAFDFYSDLKDEWRPVEQPKKGTPGAPSAETGELIGLGPGFDPSKDDLFQEAMLTLAQTRNLILYGPPGTGKTFYAAKLAERLARGGSGDKLSQAARLQAIAEPLTFHEILALAIAHEDSNGKFSVSELESLPIVDARFKMSPVKHPKNQIWGYLQTHTSPESLTVQISRRAEPFLFDKDAESRWFLTQGGNEYVNESLSNELGQMRSSPAGPSDWQLFQEWITFHQSYAYEEFVEGIRPVMSEDESAAVTFEVTPGVLMRIAARAGVDPDNDYVLVIDEINRGNIAKIFGELITLLEDDKREGQANEVKVRLPYSRTAFSLPANLYVIGTMNTADRSIALLDIALRRRFAFVEVMPKPELLDGVVVHGESSDLDLGELLRAVNRSISRVLDRDHQIGHSYLLPLSGLGGDTQLSRLGFVWRRQILPLMREYFFNQPDKLLEILAPMFGEALPTWDEGTPTDALDELGRLADDDLVDGLTRLAKS